MVDVLTETRKALKLIDREQITKTVEAIYDATRVFCLGNGGGYAHAMHFASDLRKIAKQPAYSFDNLAELTARVNDDGWDQAWQGWLTVFDYSTLHGDMAFLFSVGGAMGDVSRNLQPVETEYGIVGANGGHKHRIVIPSTSTPVIEGCQSVIAHHIIEQLCG